MNLVTRVTMTLSRASALYIEEDRVDVGSVGHLGRTQRVSGIDVSIGLDVRLHVVRRITFARAITSMLVDGDSA